MVLFHERAGAAVPQSALSARLQHRAPRLVLAVPSAVAVSLERLFSRGRQALLQARRSRRDELDCSPYAGPASSWCSSPSPPPRNIIRCRAIRRSRCCSVRRWQLAERGFAAERAFFPGFCCRLPWSPRPCGSCREVIPRPAIFPMRFSRTFGAYTLSLGHMEDLKLNSFAYLRLPLLVAGARIPDRRHRDHAIYRAVARFWPRR